MPGFEVFGDEEKREVGEVLETGVLFRYGFDAARKGRWKARTFEAELAKRLQVNHCLLVSSGTASLNVALAACGIGAGDEVILSPFTFVATFEAVLAVGAVPVFAEMDDTFCLDPRSAARAITPRTRAIVPVHMCGSMADIRALRELCDEKGLILLEDACQAVGATYRGRAAGTFGHVGCFSFDPVKTITCGEGGAVVTNDPALFARADQFADHGHDHLGNDRGKEGHPILGFNFRISELNAAVGVAQLRKLDSILATQLKNKKFLKSVLEKVPGVSFRRIPDPDGDSATFLSFLLPDEDSARKAAKDLAEAGVDGCFYWFDNNWHYFRQWNHLKKMASAYHLPVALLESAPDYESVSLPVSDGLVGRMISMQIKLSWSDTDLTDRASRIRKVFGL